MVDDLIKKSLEYWHTRLHCPRTQLSWNHPPTVLTTSPYCPRADLRPSPHFPSSIYPLGIAHSILTPFPQCIQIIFLPNMNIAIPPSAPGRLCLSWKEGSSLQKPFFFCNHCGQKISSVMDGRVPSLPWQDLLTWRMTNYLDRGSWTALTLLLDQKDASSKKRQLNSLQNV